MGYNGMGETRRNHLSATFTDAELDLIEKTCKALNMTKGAVIRMATLKGLKEMQE